MSNTTRVQLDVTDECAGERLDRFLAERASASGHMLSRTRLKALILGGHVLIGGRPVADPSFSVQSGDRIELDIPPPQPAEPKAERIALNIVFEDAHLLVLDKPAGLVVHPAAGHDAGTLVNALIAHCGESLSGIGGVKRPGIVHRLDKDTSGLLVVAKTDAAHRKLTAQFADHGRSGPLERGYLALVWGAPERPRGRIDVAIGRHPHARDK
ncbi:MAG: RluA family pseudouridine synthase, partial [Methylobacteriaceae bacterium]|nr:RluA family pseudouridine synthase [Methylobacteriaceae bacterium]